MSDNITKLGDVHLGRKFVTGVPLHRRGDREAMVWKQFTESLWNCKTLFHVQTGDLFDQFAVPEALLLATALVYKDAALFNPDTTYVIYRGNHDASRDTDKASSFDVLAELLSGIENIYVLRDPTTISHAQGHLGFIPWHPFKSSEELAQELISQAMCLISFEAIFGHFEVDSFGGHDFNLIPTKTLAAVTKTIYTGHIHLPTEFERDGVRVVVVGSMQPYAHGEDPRTDWYETVSFTDLQEDLEDGTTRFQDINLRVIVRPGEVVPEVDCLSLITKPFVEKVEEDDEPDNLEVNFADFNMHSLFTGCLAEAQVRPVIAERIMNKYEELKNV